MSNWQTCNHTPATSKVAALESVPGRWLLPAALPSKSALLDVLDKDRNLLTSGCDVTRAA